MSHLLHRNLRRAPPLAASATGLTVRDRHGRAYLDACSGAAVSALGHAHPEVLAAMHAQIDRHVYTHSAYFSCAAAEELACRLAHDAPGDLDHVSLVSGGSEAMECALKLARQYYVEAGQSERSLFIARRQSYHGATLGALAVGDHAQRRAPFAPLLMPVARVAPCYEYRDRAEGQSSADYTAMLLAEIEATILAQGPQTIIAFVAETVAGATNGAVPPTPGYFRGVRQLCDQYGLLLILDEVMCGMGRTGTLYAFEQEGVLPDLVVLGKGLGAGYQAIGAVLARQHLIQRLRDGSGAFQHGHTYMSHPVAAAAALAVQQVLQRDGLLGAVMTRGAGFRRQLREVLGQHPHVGDIRGRGLLLALELVRERSSKQPFDPACQLHAQVREQALARGLMVYPMGGTIDGRRGDHILLAPPFIATEAELTDITGRLADALTAALARVT